MAENIIEKDCIYYSDKFIEKLEKKLDGCSANYKMYRASFPFFNNLSIFFPEAYLHMLKVLEIEND